ncbi:MAG: hypothetical protein JNJ83_14675 [Verrucomicrobiaceae bacterium]|nr:hypothetical protein [Verrucomicrobiaceae bacterium]
MLRSIILLFITTLVQAGASAPAPVSVKLHPKEAGQAVPMSFAGFSREWRRFPYADTGRPETVHPKYLQLLRNLCAFNDKALSIRIGGASADGIKEVPDANRWQQIRQVYEATRTPLIITLNLARGDVQFCKDFIHRAKEHLPAEAIAGFELGNEPDGWFGRHRPKDYRWETYFDEFAAMRAALVPGEIRQVIGPAWAHGLPPDIAATLLKMNPGALSMFTGHAYSLSPKTGPHPEKLLIADVVPKTVTFLTPGIQAAHEAGLPFRLGECGSAWGGGIPGVSDSFASALWIMDFCMSLAEAGLDGVNFHGGGKGHYSPIQDDSDDKKFFTRSITPKPSYYGLLLFAEATAHRARFIPVERSTDEKVRLWATLDEKGTRRLLIINKHLDQPITVQLNTESTSHLTLKRLTAPAIGATEGIRIGGQTFDGSTDGLLVGTAHFETPPPPPVRHSPDHTYCCKRSAGHVEVKRQECPTDSAHHRASRSITHPW